MRETTPVAVGGRCLLHADTRAPVMVGEIVQNHRGETYAVMGGTPPRHTASSGMVDVAADGTSANVADYYPHVFGLVLGSGPDSRA